jgi:integrase/recombinase XerD
MSRNQSRAPEEFVEDVEGFLGDICLERGLSANTMDAYRRDLDQAAVFFARQSCSGWKAVTGPQARKWIHSLGVSAGCAPATLARKLTALRVFSRYLVREKRREDDFTALLTAPKLKRRLPATLSYEEIARLMAAPAGGHPAALRDQALLELFYSSGLRVSELANLTFEQVDLEHGFLRVFGKGSKERMVPVGARACDSLKTWIQAGRPHIATRQHKNRVFLNRRGQGFSRVGLWMIVKKYGRLAGCVKAPTPHTFRHSFATHLLSGGADLRSIQEMLGHASVATTQIYTSVESGRFRVHHKRHHPRSKLNTKLTA